MSFRMDFSSITLEQAISELHRQNRELERQARELEKERAERKVSFSLFNARVYWGGKVDTLSSGSIEYCLLHQGLVIISKKKVKNIM